MDDKIKNWYQKFGKKKFPYMFILIAIIAAIIMDRFTGIMPGDDMWWHVRAGQEILSGNFPKIDIFSWIYAGKDIYWVSHEWLSEVILALIHDTFGLNAMYFYSITCITIVLGLLIYFNRDKIKTNFIMTLIWFCAGAFTISHFSTPRPHLLGFIILAIFTYFLFKFIEDESSKGIFLLPLLTVLWVNTHGGSSNLTYIMPIIALCMGLFDFSLGRVEMKKLSKKQLKTLLLISVINFGCLFINPHTYKTVLYPFEGMTETFQLGFIIEWKAPDISTSVGFAALLIPIIMALNLMNTNKKINIIDLAYFGFFALLTLKSIRFTNFFFIVNTFTYFKYVNELKFKGDKICGLPKIDIKFVTPIVTILMLISSTASFMVAEKNAYLHNEKSLIDEYISSEALDVVKKDNPKRIYNHYNYGGQLIYNNIPVFVDSRADLYWGKILENAIELSEMQNLTGGSHKFNAEKILNEYQFDAFLIPKSTPLYRYLKTVYNLDVLYSDEDAVYFKLKGKKCEALEKNENNVKYTGTCKKT